MGITLQKTVTRNCEREVLIVAVIVYDSTTYV